MLRIPGNRSIKGKRRVAQSIISTVRAKYNVAVAEVQDQELWQTLTLGVSCISNDRSHANEMLSRVVAFIESSRSDVELLDYEVEMVSGV